jgi:hypothetical protein
VALAGAGRVRCAGGLINVCARLRSWASLERPGTLIIADSSAPASTER